MNKLYLLPLSLILLTPGFATDAKTPALNQAKGQVVAENTGAPETHTQAENDASQEPALPTEKRERPKVSLHSPSPAVVPKVEADAVTPAAKEPAKAPSAQTQPHSPTKQPPKTQQKAPAQRSLTQKRKNTAQPQAKQKTPSQKKQSPKNPVTFNKQ